MGWFSGAPKVNTDERAVDELLTRGVMEAVPRELAVQKLRSGNQLRVYLGVDPTGAKLHLGHSVPLRKLKAFADLGHHVIFLVGSFTAMVGDPTGRDTAREPLNREQVEKNFKTYKAQASKILDFSKVELRYNHEWLEKMQFADIMKLASNFTVQQMLERDMFRERIKREEDLSPNEFLYPLMQGYDSVMLDVDCEIGGNDQLFNMLAGRKLQKAFGKREKFVLTTKLIEGTDGRKMSKTYDNAVYLDDVPTEMYGKLMSIKDELVPTYFETLTDVPMAEVAEILKSHPKEAKQRLAKEIVALYHGKGAAEKAEAGFMKPDDAVSITIMKGQKLRDIAQQLQLSMSEMRRLVDQGAIEVVGGKKLSAIDAPLMNTTLKIGKHRFIKIVVK
ncbi:tyrosine--tRNA ligase [Candidatus Adlerbacteria bacterium RIFCSPHIGHO2_12_FULL_53_18]|uniref:Tyrosine--tRNA ligase n=1 Tax=Candidatus Adlerbacteria bacterium RIFCSPHIGHO2_12_FULL_53_18 TaxID=1797242 RepID=A0A1F4XRX6_9BACT|nr:MAG: tyrosine--tRNA ligase [Candidatus Adlerbacteria bacterium RIFCSPHIGHO2_12_FULL_53_18]